MAKKITYLILFVIILMSIIQTNVYASTNTGLWKDLNMNTDFGQRPENDYSDRWKPIDNPEHYKPSDTSATTGTNKLEKIGNKIIGPIRIIGTITAVITLIALGIKYIVGSAEEKAEYKKSMMPYVIGAIMVFGITNLLGIVIDIVEGLK